MDDLISRQAAIDISKDLTITVKGYEMHNQAVMNYCADIMQLPSAQPKKIRGQWIDKGWTGDWQYLTDGRGNCWRNIVCSECGESVRHESNFCPNCGAKMEVTTPPECEGDCGWCKPSVIEKCKGVTE